MYLFLCVSVPACADVHPDTAAAHLRSDVLDHALAPAPDFALADVSVPHATVLWLRVALPSAP